MRYGITGPHGHIGTVLLEARPWPVSVALDADVRDYEALRDRVVDHLGPDDVIIHTAAVVNSLACDVAGTDAIDVNVGGTWNVVRICRELGLRLVYFSTTAVYDPAGERPYTEESVPRPRTLYGITKYAGEMIAIEYMPIGRVLALRPCFIYGGPHDVSNVASLLRAHRDQKVFISQLDPEKVKDWMYVTDFVDATWALIDRPEAWNRVIYNISRGTPEPFQKVLDLLGDKGKLPPQLIIKPEDDYLGDHIVSNDRLQEAIDHEAIWLEGTTSIEEGIEKCSAC